MADPSFKMYTDTGLSENHVGISRKDDESRRTEQDLLSKEDFRKIQSFTKATLFESKECVHHLVNKSVQQIPNAEAIAASDGSLTYKELDQRSSLVAYQLLEHGIKPGQFVPFYFEKSIWLVVAIVGILKAGGAIVPIGVDQPPTRIAKIVQQTKANIVVVSDQLSTSIKESTTQRVLTVSARSTGNLSTYDVSLKQKLPRVVESDAALVLYTSGSTGTPKGIVHDHRAISTKVLVEGKAFGFQSARVLQFAAVTWDVFIMDVFTTLAFRGCICMPTEEDRRFNLACFSKDHDVNFSILTPSLANTLDPADFETLRTIVFGGEALKTTTVKRWSVNKKVKLLQGYGPAETGPCIAGEVLPFGQPENVGRALDNSCCVLVDPSDPERLVPVGTVGELLVGGPSILQSYLNEPDKTKEALVERPRWAWDLRLSSTLFYRTGDLLRYSLDASDGSFEFVGRKDTQVKYHGQRLEIEEIEHHLRSIPDIKVGVVAVPKQGRLKDRLVAVVGLFEPDRREQTTPLRIVKRPKIGSRDIRKFLSSVLPSFMIPTDVLVVNAVPFTSSMKVDRQAVEAWLCQHDSTHSHLDEEDTTNPTHQRQETTARTIANEYARLVSRTSAEYSRSVEDYEICLQEGGIDSIQVISLSIFIKKRFGVQIPMSLMLGSKTTIGELAEFIDCQVAESRSSNYISRADDEVAGLLDDIEQDTSNAVDNINVFLTGATGFLGIEILKHLFTKQRINVHVLIKSTSIMEAKERLIAKASQAGWWQAEYADRLSVWLGDLARPRLGLSAEHWQMLCSKHGEVQNINIIIHNGAEVHYTKDYAALKGVNVSSTVELLKTLVHRDHSLDSFVYVSGGHQLSFEDDSNEVKHAAEIEGSHGYVKSKAVSELLVRKYIDRKHLNAEHIRIVKPGFIIADEQGRQADPKDFLWRLIAACVNVGAYDESRANKWIFVADKRRVASAVVASALDKNVASISKVLDGMTLKTLWLVLQRVFRYDLVPLQRHVWLSKVREAIVATQSQHPLFPLIHSWEGITQTLGVDGGSLTATKGVEAAVTANLWHLFEIGFLRTSTPSRTTLNMRTQSGISTPSSSSSSTVDAIDVQTIRRHFPALDSKFVAFNNAAGTVVLKEAWEATRDFMSAFPVEFFGDDEDSLKKTAKLEADRQILATFVNADPDEIAWGQSTTFLLRCLGQALKPLMSSDAEMVVSNMCHEASASAWVALARELGITIKWWAPPAGDDPCLSLETLKPLLTPKTRLVTCNHVSNVVGTIHPIRQIADMVHQIPGALLIVDGVAWAPHRPVDVKALNVDFYCFSWYKVFGPHTAQLYGRRSVQARMMTSISHYFLDGMPGLDWKLRLGNNAFELETALAPIATYLKQVGWDAIIAQETVLTDAFLTYLNKRRDVFRIFGEKTSDPNKRVSVVTFCVKGHSSSEFASKILQGGRFRITSGECWAPRPTHDVLGLPDDGLIRVSFVHYNTVAEVGELCQLMDKCLLELRL